MNDTKKIDFRNQNFRDILTSWWLGLEKDTGGRAELRRAKNPDDVYISRTFQSLVNKLREAGYKVTPMSMDRLALAAGLIAHVSGSDNDPTQRVPEAMASEGDGRRAKVSDLRFRRIISIKDQDRNELYLELLRLVRLLKRVNIIDLAEAAYWWNDRVRKNWAVDYYSRLREES